uniref:Large ribosomal subunit protein bL20c n=1 Tax=Callipsygma wilsonis TaxID=2320807 RepID=A0A386AZZ5_9CHLO|nr:ribosomal protein L20 [Callipsygma wilsonis]AYC65026.1 ribosomal protein L20 [Callipsygma wilsonis]
MLAQRLESSAFNRSVLGSNPRYPTIIMEKHSYKGRCLKKRKFRSLWICRLNARMRLLGKNYHSFIKKNKNINRKIYAQLIFYDSLIFKNDKIKL